ncbi:hypothetical protein A0128_15395 [Leptospira tipperaryensis]|uniref:Uncharacterized protein n=1 Tax=Leptospira tipperaryensis TaxID=2564040 RepID=A0A1D7UZU4_9LEPT|nr:hypothetical protein A0128_15395 [Leptospira tipperaryensis]
METIRFFFFIENQILCFLWKNLVFSKERFFRGLTFGRAPFVEKVQTDFKNGPIFFSNFHF